MTHERTGTHIKHMHALTHIHACTNTLTNTHTHTHIRTHTHAHTRSYRNINYSQLNICLYRPKYSVRIMKKAEHY